MPPHELYSLAGQTIFQLFSQDGVMLPVWESYPTGACLDDGKVDRTRAISRTRAEYQAEQTKLRAKQ